MYGWWLSFANDITNDFPRLSIDAGKAKIHRDPLQRLELTLSCVMCNIADRVRLFVHYTILFSSLFKLIWGHWTNEMSVRYILSSVWVRLSIFFQLSIIQYMGLCVFSLSTSLVMIERIYTLSYYHHQIGSMNYYPLLRVRSWSNGMRCKSIYSYWAQPCQWVR